MRLVLDCNVLVAAARTDGTCRRVLLSALRLHEIVVAEPILAEYRDVAARPKQRAVAAVLAALIDHLEAVGIMVDPVAGRFSLADPDDEAYLATAVAGRAEVLVTGNARDFVASPTHSINILSPRAFLDRAG